MAIQSLTARTDTLPTIDEVMERTGLDHEAAALHLLVISGEALTNDRELIAEDQLEAVLRAEEEAESLVIAELSQQDSEERPIKLGDDLTG